MTELTPKQARRKAYYHANREKHLIAVKEWRIANPEKYKAQLVRAYAKHRDGDIERLKAWKVNNPEKHQDSGRKYRVKYHARVMAHVRKYQATKMQAMPKWVSFSDTVKFYEEAKRLTELGIPSEVDHIVPLTSKIVCGLHCPANLQVLSVKENRSKRNRYWPDMP
jgi:hypothetical protein